ncbi:membrane protein insertase YidC [Lactiplantibacillus mudanjiangensis]|uniref:Membrane protein insertase YidC n=1 Tax=Lactiplantibacillus mudanjiangensis TaxID=1296538 RepID=A0A660E495_9LACO|nr:membrane protein insertase YidC [Lactiplantibacillus mudanjiangensis]VDG20904.1 cell division protein [Lactobacillus plantarum JDM1] [Lactiplantibacillus mudanjiangensis]VDG22635.1 cell division protein [Lactobacillus plantarum JDM1] [Lactiplantibacillus mudanjiangensis]VDG26824.1 cell division protein [Lactobacillus plantarum JDM1] [Lactiplantibacillus mudanjiangensis]VDG31966.1 cell division protein [Lactobacillus plantarum JDM1] [Lactiplantibacillus mudanjiangensis]
MKKYRKILAMLSVLAIALVLTGCSNTPITDKSTGFWDGGIILNFSRAIIWLSHLFGQSYGLGIIAFTLIIRIIILPLMIFQTRSMLAMQEIQPQMKALQKQYSSRDMETQQKLQAEMKKLYSKHGVHPMASMLPLLVQLPILIALYQAIWRTQVLKSGTFLWLQLGSKDPYYILPILAALFTFASSWLAMKSQPEQNGMTQWMTYLMPLVILVTAINVPSALSLYWVISNAFQVGQTMLLQNPFKINRQRAEKQQAAKDRQRAIERAKKRAIRNHKR